MHVEPHMRHLTRNDRCAAEIIEDTLRVALSQTYGGYLCYLLGSSLLSKYRVRICVHTFSLVSVPLSLS